jgi:gliding motility-associated-like protein
MKSFYFLFILFFIQKLIGQSLIINEFSNGPTGAQEYIEFIVVDPNFVQNCDGNPPPCVDVRGWIIDDNSGYHGTGGVAPGCNRFSFDPLWQCIPLGTIIVIYNNVEPNINLPADDISMSDNNCKLIIPINNSQLFESNSTTPGSVACSYPSSGWVAGGIWANIGMANTGDCVRLVNLSGCEVFSLCYASVNLNTQIYFNSGNSGTDNVWYFNNGDYNLQINWSEGCADPTSCGANNQTPGLPNNTLNSSYIAQFNNNCQPILPVTVNAGNNISVCANTTISLSGLAAGTYTSVVWSGGSGTFSSPNTVSSNYTLGNNDTGSFMLYLDAFNLCGVPTRDSIEITILELTNIQISNTGPYCPNEAIQLNAPNGYTYSWSGPNSFTSNLQNPTIVLANSLTSGTYSVLVTDPATNCQNTFTTSVALNNLPIIDVSSVAVQITPASCGLTDGAVIGASASGTSPFSYYWTDNTGLIITTGSDLNSVGTGVYYFVATDANGCKDSTSVSITNLNGPAAPSFQTINPVCEGSTQIFTISNALAGATYTWSLGSTIVQTGLDLTSLSVSNFSSSNTGPYTVEVNSGGCSNFSTISGNLIPKPIPTITGNTAVCVGNTIQLDATSSLPSTGIQFQWYLNNSLIPNETNSTLSVNNSGNYQVLVSANGCDSISNAIQITVNSLPLIDITNQILVQSTCGLNNASVSSISVTGNSPFNYNWTNGLGVSFSNTIDLNNASAGQYYFVVTDANGCKDSIQYQLTSTPVPQTPILIAPNQVCEGSTIILNVNNADPNLNYSWNFNGNTIQSGIGLDTLVIISGTLQNAGTYEVIATNGICSADTFMVISVIEHPIPQIIASGLSFCSGNSVTLSVTNNINFNYQWYLDSQLIPGENNNSIDVNTGGNYQVLVSNNGCDSLSSSITITELASPLLIANSVSSCLNQPTQLAASGANSYSWIGTTGQFNSAIINIDSSQAGVYTFTLTGTSINGCTSDTVVYATVFNSPIILINGIENDTVSFCENESITLTASGGTNYIWSNLSTSNPLNISFNQDTSIAVIGTDANGCLDSTTVFISFQKAPNLLGTPTICNGYSTQLYLDTNYVNQQVTWTNSTGNVISTQDTITISSPGNFNLTVNVNSCTFTKSIEIGQSSINASFVPDTTLGVAPLTIHFINTSSGATNYYWLLGNGDTTTAFSPSTIYQQPGTYVAYLLVSNPQYCVSSYALQIVVLEENEIFPNIFSPNGDGVNDEFFIKETGIKSLNCKIYNRWGNLVHELNKPDARWKPGKDFSEGTYYFIADLTFFNDINIKKQGYILLVR